MIARELEKLRGNDFMQMLPDLEALFDSIWCKSPQSRWEAAVQLLVLTSLESDAARGCSHSFHPGSL